MKLIPLTQGKFAKVDDADFDWINQWKWYAKQERGIWYAVRDNCAPRGCGKRKHLRMHREILSVPVVDHWDGDGLNNQRGNLRDGSGGRNQANSRKPITNTSGFKGCYWDARMQKWFAQISVKDKSKFLGRFDSKIEAAQAYDNAARRYYGNFARLNFSQV